MIFSGIEYSEELCNRIREYYYSYADELGFREFCDQYLQAQLENKLAKFIVKEARSRLPINHEIMVLDMGSGLGGLVSEFKKTGINCLGIDADSSTIEIAKKRQTEEGLDHQGVFYCAEGERLPFHSDLFDMVCSITAVEHVRDIEKYLNEAYRVIKPGGLTFIVAPNFFTFWEGHYRVYTPPFLMYLSKRLFKVYLKLYGRNTAYSDKLNFKINPRYLTKLLANTGFVKIEDISLSRMKELFHNPDTIVDEAMSDKVKKVLSNLLGKFAINIAVKFIGAINVYHPIILFARKPA